MPLPATEKGVSNGNKVFGAAILNADLQCEIASTNAETDCPIFHGEVKCIVDWSQQTPSAERGPRALSGVFLATHEPCCMCVSSILWAGFKTLVAGAWSKRKKMFLGGSFLKLADDNKYIKNPEAQNREVRGF